MKATAPAVWYRPGRRPSRGAVAGLLVSLALVAAATLAPANTFAAAPAGFVGLQSWDSPTSAELDTFRRAKVKVVRAQVSWAGVEATKGEYRWDFYDRLFADAGRQGITILPVLLGSPAWATSKRGSPPDSKSERQAFYDFAKAAAYRYRPNSAFWRTRGINGTLVGARQLQVWNEPNLGSYWNGRPNASEYARLVRGANEGIKRGNPDATTILGGMPWSRGPTPPDFLRAMFRADPKLSNAFGSAAVHPYDRTPDGSVGGVRLVRQTLNRLPGARYRSIWVTEIGWATGRPDNRFQVREATQARNLELFYNKLLAVRKSYRIKGAIWFSVKDRPRADWWAERTGLVRGNGSAKPSWYRLKCVTGAPGCRR